MTVYEAERQRHRGNQRRARQRVDGDDHRRGSADPEHATVGVHGRVDPRKDEHRVQQRQDQERRRLHAAEPAVLAGDAPGGRRQVESRGQLAEH